jgi:aminopeptidase N
VGPEVVGQWDVTTGRTEHVGEATLDESFQATYDNWPADDPFWTVVIGDPGVVDLFHEAVYFWGAMTVHTLRQQVGDDAFFAILQGWLADRADGNGTTEEFIAYAEAVSGQQRDDLFETWLYTPSRPELTAASAAASPAAVAWVEEAQLRAAN